MPRDLAMAVKEYMARNQEKYYDAAKYTGPISATQLYHQARASADPAAAQPVFFSMDDPYWTEYYQKNYRREDNWRLPSVLAWDHKPKGILGEIIDFDRMERVLKEAEEMHAYESG